jgi:hypothetical protein
MTQKTRILIALGILLVVIAAVLGIDALRRSSGEPELAPGSIPIVLDGTLVGGFAPTELDRLEQASFVDAEEGKTQEGWRLRDALLLHVQASDLQSDSRLIVSSSSRGKSAGFTWAEVEEPDNLVLLVLSGRGTLKLVSVLQQLDTRDEWVQDVDGIEVISP